MKRCLITGASGLIGSSLVRSLAAHWEVHAVSRRAPRGKSAGAVWHPLDLSAPFDVRKLPRTVDAVVYLAQSEHFREFPEKAREIFEVNTASLLRLLEYARRSGARRFVFASSGGVYGAGAASLDEDAPVAAGGNLGFYLGTKLCSEILVRNYASLMGAVILRFFFVYGPGQRASMLIPRLLRSVREGKPIALHGADGIQLNPTYVSDAAEAVVRALGVEGSHTINIAGPEVLTLRQVCEAMGRVLGKRPVFEGQAGEPRHIVGDTAKMRELLGAPRVGFDEGLRRLLGRR